MDNEQYTIKLVNTLKNRVSALVLANAELEAALLVYQEQEEDQREEGLSSGSEKTKKESD